MQRMGVAQSEDFRMSRDACWGRLTDQSVSQAQIEPQKELGYPATCRNGLTKRPASGGDGCSGRRWKREGFVRGKAISME